MHEWHLFLANAGSAFHCLRYGTQRMDGTFSLANAGSAFYSVLRHANA